MVAKTILFWAAVLWLGFMVWRLVGLAYPIISHGVLAWISWLGCEILAFAVVKTLLCVLVWLFAGKPGSAKGVNAGSA